MAAPIATTRQSTRLRLNELAYHPHSFADDAGRLFLRNGLFYRGINADAAPFFQLLFDQGLIADLTRMGLLIDSRVSDVSIDGYPLVIDHRAIRHVSYPQEWCPEMLRDAALTIVNLATKLLAHGLSLKDAHPWNVLFDNYKPVYVDLTSISPKSGEGWSACDEFLRFCYYPLVMMSIGQERIARCLLTEYEGILRTDLLTFLLSKPLSRAVLSHLRHRGMEAFRRLGQNGRSEIRLITRIVRQLEELKFEHDEVRSNSDAGDKPKERESLDRLLERLNPADVLDLSGPDIWTSLVPATKGIAVVSLSKETIRVSKLYQIAQKIKLPILPLILDFVKPTPSVGYSSHYSIAAVDRLKCDLVIALGLVDRVSDYAHLSSDLIAEGLAAFSKRWALIDYTNHRVNRDELIASLRRRFARVTNLETGSTKTLLLLEK